MNTAPSTRYLWDIGAVEEQDGVSQAPANFPSFEQYWPGPVIFFALHMQDTAALESGAQFGMHTPRFEPNGIDGTKPRIAPDTHVDAELQRHDSGFVDEQVADPHAGAGAMDVSAGQNQFGGIRTVGSLHRHTESVIEFNLHAGIDSSGMGVGIEFETGQEYPISARTPPQLQGRETDTPSACVHVGKQAPLFKRRWASSEKMHSLSGGHKQFEFVDGTQFIDPQTGWEHVPRTTVSFCAVPVKLDRMLQATSLPPPFSSSGKKDLRFGAMPFKDRQIPGMKSSSERRRSKRHRRLKSRAWMRKEDHPRSCRHATRLPLLRRMRLARV
ncbi:hypothetical protein HDU80_009545 [Chytriomyces hyalinus]|nr:hypothetical protein HDU80_009545 [Chytriomyces hyalinus]